MVLVIVSVEGNSTINGLEEDGGTHKKAVIFLLSATELRLKWWAFQ